jgi:hypothetical protein
MIYKRVSSRKSMRVAREEEHARCSEQVQAEAFRHSAWGG